MIGKGSMSNVFLVRHVPSGRPLAMKSINKQKVLDDDVLEHTRLEQDILLNIEHPFFVSMQYVFVTDSRIIYIMNFVRGGDLLTHIMKSNGFSEEMVQFIAA
mmetsp:Transcript_31524/g.23386  ORF Transcript_31524/g.23386 Transcript_31524/m.23386 type:complete len:102 (-) Transcript_31524:595-900(-)